MKSVFINKFQVVLPKNRISQPQLLDWMIKNHCRAEELKDQNTLTKTDLNLLEKIFRRYAVKEDQISARYIESDDVNLQSKENAGECVYDLDSKHPQGLNIEQRAQFFSKRALEIFENLYGDITDATKPNHLIHVTCTGYISPSAPQRLIAKKKWESETEITHAYHMGCYAALPSLRLAQALTLSHEEVDFKTDIVHTEMCALHMNPLAQTPEQMVVQTLFADGHIKYRVQSRPLEDEHNFRVVGLLERVIPDSEQDMSWLPTPWGMQMNLSREVPMKIKSELKAFFSELLEKSGHTYMQSRDAVYAVHPGGPKIIDAVQEILELSEMQIKHSKKILFERGNMSSATLPHVWNDILQTNYPSGTIVISFAFGPGLTLFGSVFEVG